MLQSHFSLYETTGLYKKEFFKVFNLIKDSIHKPRTGKKFRFANSLIAEARLALVLCFFRRGPNYNFKSE